MVAFSKKRRLGNMGEDIACRYLEAKGFAVIERNHLRPWGEIDIIARKSQAYHFFEVKTISRESRGTGTGPNMSAEDHIHPAKLKKLARTVDVYMANVGEDVDYQVDVVTVELDFATRRASCTLYERVL